MRGAAGMLLIASIDWDASAERLAVACGADHPSAGQVALFSTNRKPVIAAQLIGMIKPGANTKSETAVSFHQSYSCGALLAVRHGVSSISTVPLIFTRGSS